MSMPSRIHLAQASRSSAGIQLILGVSEVVNDQQIMASARPVISIGLSDDAGRGLHDWLEHLMRSDD